MTVSRTKLNLYRTVNSKKVQISFEYKLIMNRFAQEKLISSSIPFESDRICELAVGKEFHIIAGIVIITRDFLAICT